MSDDVIAERLRPKSTAELEVLLIAKLEAAAERHPANEGLRLRLANARQRLKEINDRSVRSPNQNPG